MRSGLLSLILLLAALAAPAQQGDFHRHIEEGQRLLDDGEYDAAVEAMRQAQIEHPEAEVVPYGIGAAYFEKGRALAAIVSEIDAAIEARTVESVEAARASRAPIAAEAAEAFGAARDAFARLENAANPVLRREAAVGRAAAQAFMARLADSTHEYQDQLKGMREAIGELDAFTRQYPDHAAARHNLDAARLGLKELLQAPPPPPPPQEQNASGDEQEDQEEQEEEQESPESGDASDDTQEPEEGSGPEDQQPQEPGQDGPEADDAPAPVEQDGDPRDQPQPDPGDELEQPWQPEDNDADNDALEHQAQQLAEADREPPDMQNIEAILESLEELDRREQKSMRRPAYGQDMRGGWW